MSRLIDADALKLAVVEEGQRSRRYKIGQTWELNRDEIWKAIDSIPTIEERTGKWIDIKLFGIGCIKCSECNYTEMDMPEARSKFCPECGAKMEG